MINGNDQNYLKLDVFASSNTRQVEFLNKSGIRRRGKETSGRYRSGHLGKNASLGANAQIALFGQNRSGFLVDFDYVHVSTLP